jgi:hypothetical protein
MAMADKNHDFERALDLAAYALLQSVACSRTNALSVFHHHVIELLRMRGGIVGRHVEAITLREVLCAITERSMAIFERELSDAMDQRSPTLSNSVKDELARSLRGLTNLVENSLPTAH